MSGAAAEDAILLTIFLKTISPRTWREFRVISPSGHGGAFSARRVEIVSWNVVMGIGQIVTLRLPPGCSTS